MFNTYQISIYHRHRYVDLLVVFVGYILPLFIWAPNKLDHVINNLIDLSDPPVAIINLPQLTILSCIVVCALCTDWSWSISMYIKSVLSTNRISAIWPSLLVIGQRKWTPCTFLLWALIILILFTAQADGAALLPWHIPWNFTPMVLPTYYL